MAPSSPPHPLLEMRAIRKSFAGTEVLHGVDLSLSAGEVLALLGENGAGKSTLMKILNGDYWKDSGEIFLDGKALDLRAPRDAQRAGIRVVYQELNDAPDLCAAENILLGRLPRRARWFPASLAVDWSAAHRRAGQVLSELNADFPPQRSMRRLSVGQRQVVEIAKALSASTAARVLVMDEPTAALTPREVDVLFDTIASLRRQGVGIIYISHRLDEVQRVAQRVMVLRDGHVAGIVDAAATSRREIVKMMVGRDVTPPPPAAPASSAPSAPPEASAPPETASQPAPSRSAPAIDVSNLSRSGAFESVSFAVHPGEIIGLFGLLGAGHLDVTRVLFGDSAPDSGEVHLAGRRVIIRSPRQARRAGIGLVAEDRKTDGLIPAMSVADNLLLAHWSAVAAAGVVSRRRQLRRAREWVARLGVRLKSGVRQPIETLSGGNQQKVILARWLEAGVGVLLLNEPTRGVDVGARADIYALLAELRGKGLAVVVCSSDLEEILEIADRIIVFAKGRRVAEFDRRQASRVSLLAAAAL
jgi:ribose transport system ATP-binding protein